jgi:membrane protease YdiL (CAAX protease family)
VLLMVSVVGIVLNINADDKFGSILFLIVVDAAIVLLYCFLDQRPIIAALCRPLSIFWLIAPVGLGFLTFLVATGILHAMHAWLKVPMLNLSESASTHGGLLAAVLLYCIQPAIVEELAFRGVVLPSLQPVLRPMEAVFISASLFMAWHLSFFSFPQIFILGVVLGWLRVHTGSLIPGMILHFTHNLLCILSEQYLWH